jgi:hypothetical protein
MVRLQSGSASAPSLVHSAYSGVHEGTIFVCDIVQQEGTIFVCDIVQHTCSSSSVAGIAAACQQPLQEVPAHMHPHMGRTVVRAHQVAA